MNRLLPRLLPILIPYVLIFGTGIMITMVQSFGQWMFGYQYEDVFFAWKSLFQNLHFIRSFFYTLYISFTSATIACIIGTILAYFIWMMPLSLQKGTIFYKIPIILPHIAGAFIILLILSPTGIISAFCKQLGLIEQIEEFPRIFYQPHGAGIILAYFFKETPFVILMVYSILIRIDKTYLLTARMLGASPFYIFIKIILPHLIPVIHTTFIILFVYSFGAFEIPYVLGDTYPGMLSIQVYQQYFQNDLKQRPIAMAILVVLLLFSIIFMMIYSKLVDKLNQEVRKI
ncbi:MAG: ABC transporter permease subunit [Spirochaetes bacterium]|nr:ABC transporter permease subunit [Spirochaetota bacterium]